MSSSLGSRASRALLHFFTDVSREAEAPPTAIVRGTGIWVEDEDGRRYIEGVSGMWCTSLGLGNEEIAEAAREQVARLSYSHLALGSTHERAVELAERLKAMSPFGTERVFLCSSGSEANDTQIKFAMLYNNMRGRPRRKRILAHQFGYHGATMASVSITGRSTMHRGYDLPASFAAFAACPSHYHFAEAGESEEDYATRLVDGLDTALQKEDPEHYAAFFVEPVISGAGVIIPPRTYYEKLQAVLARYEIDLVADEIVTAFGRLGRPFGSQAMGLEPCSLSVGKALSSGYAPIAAALIPAHWTQAILEHSAAEKSFSHGFTNGGHPLACAIALKTLEIYERDRIYERALALVPRFAAHMERLRGHPLIGDARHVGLVGAVEFAADRAARQPFPQELAVAPRCVAFARELGLIVRSVGDSIVVCPPLVITADELDDLFGRLEGALDRTADALAREGALPRAA